MLFSQYWHQWYNSKSRCQSKTFKGALKNGRGICVCRIRDHCDQLFIAFDWGHKPCMAWHNLRLYKYSTFGEEVYWSTISGGITILCTSLCNLFFFLLCRKRVSTQNLWYAFIIWNIAANLTAQQVTDVSYYYFLQSNHKHYCPKWNQCTETVNFTGIFMIIKYARHLFSHYVLKKKRTKKRNYKKNSYWHILDSINADTALCYLWSVNISQLHGSIISDISDRLKWSSTSTNKMLLTHSCISDNNN